MCLTVIQESSLTDKIQFLECINFVSAIVRNDEAILPKYWIVFLFFFISTCSFYYFILFYDISVPVPAPFCLFFPLKLNHNISQRFDPHSSDYLVLLLPREHSWAEGGTQTVLIRLDRLYRVREIIQFSCCSLRHLQRWRPLCVCVYVFSTILGTSVFFDMVYSTLLIDRISLNKWPRFYSRQAFIPENASYVLQHRIETTYFSVFI